MSPEVREVCQGWKDTLVRVSPSDDPQTVADARLNLEVYISACETPLEQ